MDVEVIKVLEQAGSQDPNVFKPASKTLKQWETQQGFYTALLNIFSNQLLPVNVRWMAIICIKNGVDRYWRKNAPSEIIESEKEFLRQGLISKFDEPINQLANQLAVLIAKIARYDCPREWISLVPTLLEVMRSSDTLSQHRALLTFLHVVKALASKRLGADRQIFQELTSNVFSFILNLWNTYTESFILLISSGAPSHQIQEAVEKALLSLRILGKLIINGKNKPSENQEYMLFLKVIFERIRTSLECRKSLESRGLKMEVCDKYIINLTKVLLGVLDNHPDCYVDLIPASLENAVFYGFTEAGVSLTFERFTIQCLNLFKKILQSNNYKPDRLTRDETMSTFLKKMNQFKEEFFTPEILTEICTRLVTHYFILTPSDLETLNTDPENFGIDDSGESCKYTLRPCTESLFLAILPRFKDTPTSVLVDLMQRHYQPVDPNDLHGILLKDAVYNAVGLAGFHLHDQVNFNQWFATTLSQELKEKSSNYRIIRRRVCWLIGIWSGIKLSADLRPEVYDVLVQALRPDEDLGVRLAASAALKLAIDDFQFNTDDFIPFLEPAFSLLFLLLQEVNECDTKMRVLHVLSFMIERIGNAMKFLVGSLNAYLPELWQQSENHYLLRCGIVSTLVHLEEALGSECGMLQPLVISVIELSCDVNQEGYIYLSEDGLELWLALLENTPIPTPPVMNLFKNMPGLLESSTDNLRLCLYIIQAYVLLSPQEFLIEQGSVIMELFRSMIGDLRSEGIKMIMKVVDLCLRVSPQHAMQCAKPLLLRVFETVYKRDEYEPLALTMYLATIARVLLISRNDFLQIIAELGKQLGQQLQVDAIFAEIISNYLNHMPLVGQQREKKLLALALCSILDVNCPSTVLQYFPRIISNIVETLNDITIVNYADCAVDSLIIDDQNSSQSDDNNYETEHLQRKGKLDCKDPVHCVVLKDLLQNQINTLRRILAKEQYDQMMQSLSVDIDQQLREYIAF